MRCTHAALVEAEAVVYVRCARRRCDKNASSVPPTLRAVYLLLMTLLDLVFEMPLPSVLDDTGTDQLLEKLRLVHGEPRFDIAPELIADKRRARLPAANT